MTTRSLPTNASRSSTPPRRPRSRPSATRSSAASFRRRARSSAVEGAESGLRRFRVAAPVVADERGEERDLGRLESPQLAVLDEVGGVAVVALAGHVLADVVQQRRELEHLAVAVAEPVQLGGLVEQPQREARRRAWCGRRRSCSAGPGSRPTRGAARAGRRTSRSGRGCAPRRARCPRAAPSRSRSARRGRTARAR